MATVNEIFTEIKRRTRYARWAFALSVLSLGLSIVAMVLALM